MPDRSPRGEHKTPPEAAECNIAEIEGRWEKAWRDTEAFATQPGGVQHTRAWVVVGCASTSGETHIGEIRGFTIADAYARFMRAQGYSVLFSMAFSSLGLSAELAAIKNSVSGPEWTKRCSERTCGLLNRLGCSFDWERSSRSSDPDVYRWTQWLFLVLLENDLIYRQEAEVDWCDSCRTVLASFQSTDGTCHYCHKRVIRATHTQWFLRVSAYVEDDAQGIENLPGWSRTAVEQQRAVPGRIDGIEIDASVVGGEELIIFTTHPDAIDEAAFVAISPAHPTMRSLFEDPQIRESVRMAGAAGWRTGDGDEKQTRVVQTGMQAVVPGASKLLPLIISASVDGRYGKTAVLGIPNRDETDRAIAEQLDRSAAQAWKLTEKAKKPRAAKRYRRRDFPISRQRPWGAPIPIVHCPNCGAVPVAHDDLPVQLPDDLQLTGKDNPLGESPIFSHCDCPRCGGLAKRETSTIDSHLDAIWLWLSTCVPVEQRATGMFDHANLRGWLPAKQMICGADLSDTVFDQRLIVKLLQNLGVLPQVEPREPFCGALLHQQVCTEGTEMNRWLDNGVDPEPLISEVGADAVRHGVLNAASPRKAFDWNNQSVRHAVRFLEALWRYAEPRLRGWGDSSIDEINEADRLRRSLSKWCQIGLQKITADYEALEMQRAIYNIARLFARIQDFEQRACEQRGELERYDRDAVVTALMLLIQVLAPVTPHIAEELWLRGGGDGLVSATPWPYAGKKFQYT